MQSPSFRARLGLIGLTIGAVLAAMFLAGYTLASAAPAIPQPKVQLAPAKAAQSGAPGVTVTYTFQVTNTGATTDTFEMKVTGYRWPTSILFPNTVSHTAQLPHSGSIPVTVTVSIPLTATGHDVATLWAISGINPAISATATLTTTALFKLYLPLVVK